MGQPKTATNKTIIIIIFRVLGIIFQFQQSVKNISISPLSQCILVDPSFVLFWTSLFVILGKVGSTLSLLFSVLVKFLLANNVDLDQMPLFGRLIWVCTVCL